MNNTVPMRKNSPYSKVAFKNLKNENLSDEQKEKKHRKDQKKIIGKKNNKLRKQKAKADEALFRSEKVSGF